MVTDGGLFFAPIATVHSCFTECVGEWSAAFVFLLQDTTATSSEGHTWVYFEWLPWVPPESVLFGGKCEDLSFGTLILLYTSPNTLDVVRTG